MKYNSIVVLLVMFFMVSCSSGRRVGGFIQDNIDNAVTQYTLQTDVVDKSGKLLNPHTVADDKIQYIPFDDWCAGFFSGSLWYLYELTEDCKWLRLAEKYTEMLDSVQYLTNTHDLGFMVGCSYLNGYRFGNKEEYKPIIIQAAMSLATRFRPNAGVIQSWDVDKGWMSKRGWECPVIIDNMMNLELLFEASLLSGDSVYCKIARKHADMTLINHFRSDFSSYHVVDYDPLVGIVRSKGTGQGYADTSAWARGQAWGLYGYILCYRYTKEQKYLEQAEKICDFIFNHKNMPEDLVPYWDYDSPDIPNTPRDASAAACTASALYELSLYSSLKDYKRIADKIMETLASPAYCAKIGENGNFILMHSVGSMPHDTEIDVPLNYADYYFLEALLRKKKLENNIAIN